MKGYFFRYYSMKLGQKHFKMLFGFEVPSNLYKQVKKWTDYISF